MGLRLGLFVLLATLVWWHDAPPAAACSCATPPELEGLEEHDAVFVGEYVRESSVSDLGDLVDFYDDHGPASGVRYEFDVDEVFKGDVAVDQTVVSERSGMCGMSTPELGTTYLVFATRESSGQLVSYLCSGTRPVTAADPPAGFPVDLGPSVDAVAAVSEDESFVSRGVVAAIAVIAGVVVCGGVFRRRQRKA